MTEIEDITKNIIEIMMIKGEYKELFNIIYTLQILFFKN